MQFLAVRTVLLASASLLLFLIACDGESGPETAYITETSGVQTETPPADKGRDFRLETPDAAVGDSVEFVLTNWDAGSPVAIFLLTEEQRQLGFNELRDADKVLLGQMEIEGSRSSFEFTLMDSYQTQHANTLKIASEDRVYLAAFQMQGRGSVLSQAGPLVVR